jgi:aryl-alcohol dehydrogenase-like predicted oxidoreductase
VTLAGYATPEGTAAYRAGFASTLSPEHFRRSQALWFSSIGLGTYLGEADRSTDQLYGEAVATALASGCNVIDTAINYRHQRSEKIIGTAVGEAVSAGRVAREQVIVCTKGGYIPFDGYAAADPRAYIHETYVRTGLARAEEIVDWNCIAPRFLEDQIERSRANLRLECIDVYYLHNPETQLERWDRREFVRRLREAFALLERKVAEGRIRLYGTATWNGYRRPSGAPEYLSLSEVVRVAEEVGGKGHHMRVAQLPYNGVMPEAAAFRNQPLGDRLVSFLEAAQALDVVVAVSAPLLQGRLSRGGPPALRAALRGLDTDAQRAIQFGRSSPGVTTVLVGMKQKGHVDENLSVARFPPAPRGAVEAALAGWVAP